MARGLNKVMIIGHLGADPEVRYMPNGTGVTHLRVATTASWKDRQTGEKQERTEWHRVSLFQKLGEIAAQYLRKGSLVYIEGSLRTSKWQDPNGADRYSTDIIGNEMRMLDKKGGEGGGGFEESDHGQSMGSKQSKPEMMPATADEAFDDEIPF